MASTAGAVHAMFKFVDHPFERVRVALFELAPNTGVFGDVAGSAKAASLHSRHVGPCAPAALSRQRPNAREGRAALGRREGLMANARRAII